jgi:gliding motility-associated-like protein
LPTLSVINDTVCRGSAGTLSASGALNYTWSTTAQTSTMTASPTNTTQYTVSGTDGNGCTGSATAEIYVNALPTINVPNTSVCPNGTVSVTASGAQTYTWSPSSTLSGSTGTSVVASPTTSPTVYTVTGTDAATGCVGSGTFTVSINSNPNISINPVTACSGASATLTASGASANSYTWSTSQTGTNTITVTAGPTSYSVIGANSNGCLDTAYVTITLLSGPTPQNITGFPVICAGQTDLLSAVPGGAGYTYSWSGPSGSLGNGSTALANQTGTYTLVTTNACGQVPATFSVYVSSPTASITPSGIQGTAPATFTFTNSSNGTGLSNYWNFGNGDSSVQISPVETFTTGGAYNITLWVVDTYGCLDTAHVTVYVSDSTALIIPNVFSPNGDGINEVFAVKGIGISSFNCKIYDRWGVAMYEWSNINGGWDGKNASNGSPASDGTYYFLITYVSGNNKTTTKPGFLQLVR